MGQWGSRLLTQTFSVKRRGNKWKTQIVSFPFAIFNSSVHAKYYYAALHSVSPCAMNLTHAWIMYFYKAACAKRTIWYNKLSSQRCTCAKSMYCKNPSLLEDMVLFSRTCMCNYNIGDESMIRSLQDVFVKHKCPWRVTNSIDSHALVKAFEK
jgi:hypothetical protein